MTTRHTITHADEIYRGNAFEDGYSPDGRRGVEMSHLKYTKMGALAAADEDFFLSSWVLGSSATSAGVNWVNLATGVGASSATPTVWTIYVASQGLAARNITITSSGNDSTKTFRVTGRDIYGNTMVESITGGNDAVASGVKAFAYVDNFTCTAVTVSTISVGIGNTIGLPFALATVSDFLGLNIDGYWGSTASVGGVSNYTMNVGLGASVAFSATVPATSSVGDRDVRGTLNLISGARTPDGTRVFGVMQNVDASSRAKAFGLPQATTLT